MVNTNASRNYIVPLGTFRGELTETPDAAWVFIHEERVRLGLSTMDIEEMADVSQTMLSRGERNGRVSIILTRKVLNSIGYDLKIVPLEKVDE
jgi:hypothetical protein